MYVKVLDWKESDQIGSDVLSPCFALTTPKQQRPFVHRPFHQLPSLQGLALCPFGDAKVQSQELEEVGG